MAAYFVPGNDHPCAPRQEPLLFLAVALLSGFLLVDEKRQREDNEERQQIFVLQCPWVTVQHLSNSPSSGKTEIRACPIANDDMIEDRYA